MLTNLIERGCAIQINCDSLIANDPLVYAIVEHGQAHCLGSDSHNMTNRRPRYGEAVERLRERFGAGACESLQKCMESFLRGEIRRFDCGKAIRRTLWGAYL